ncbi:hypothetical protein ACVWXQ_004271 [Bradyrhizobium sp. S3.14.4]
MLSPDASLSGETFAGGNFNPRTHLFFRSERNSIYAVSKGGLAEYGLYFRSQQDKMRCDNKSHRQRKSQMLSPIDLGRNDGLTRIDIGGVEYACGLVANTIRRPGT